jgi:hypothetical protein
MTEDTSLEFRPIIGKSNVFTLQEKCLGCEAKTEHIQAIKEALSEVVDENEALRTRVVELEAWVNKAGDKLEKREMQIQELYTKISAYKDT